MRRTCLVVIALAAGCMHSTHKIPHRELMRLSQTAPEARGEHVRVIQDLVGESPPPADPVTSNTTVVIVPDVHIHAGGHSHGGGSGGGGGGSSGGGSKVPNVAGDSKDAAVALVVVAAVAAVALAVTEGARYDGWVRLHPMHPVHLYGPGGYRVMPLAWVDPETAAWSTRAVVRPNEGPWAPLGRAPLDRHGFTYSVLGGAGQVVSGDDSLGLGTSFRVQFGYFPTHAFGIQLDWGFAFRDNVVGRTIFDNRTGLEATFAPLDVGKFHGGVFAGAAIATRLEDGVADGRADDLAWSAGALLQLELTTRLAITGRLGVSHAYDHLTRDALVGLSIY
jgi:hypothetical protein